MKIKMIAGLIALVVVIAGLIMYFSTPIEVGFLGPITGRHSEMGINSRDAALLAADMINRNGGIRGRKVKITVFDDKHEDAVCAQAVNELLKEKIYFVIGPMTSGMWPPAQAAAKGKGILFISPTISSDEYAGIDDNLIRINNLASEQGKAIAERMISMGLLSAAVIYDLGNRSYSSPAYDTFAGYFKANGGKILYENKMEKKYASHRCAEQIIKTNPQAVVFISNGMDAASVAQQISKRGYKGELFGTMWTKTSKINELGGRSVLGMHFVVPNERRPETENFKAVSAMFEAEYKERLNFSGINTYDSALILFKGMSKAGIMTAGQVKRAILDIREFECLQDTVMLDGNGDAKRNMMFLELKPGGFVRDE